MTLVRWHLLLAVLFVTLTELPPPVSGEERRKETVRQRTPMGLAPLPPPVREPGMPDLPQEVHGPDAALSAAPARVSSVDPEEVQPSTMEATSAKEAPLKPAGRYGTVTRLNYRYAVNGESGIALGHFHLFPNSTLIAATVEFFTRKRSREPFEFSTFAAEVNLGRPFVPSTQWGNTFGWVARFQSTPGAYLVVSGGLQWDISRTPGLTLPLQWKSFIQVLAKNRDDAGTVDIFNWYEFVLIDKRLILRGTNVWFLIPGGKDAVRLTQDLVVPVHNRFDLYLRHFFQNNGSIDETRSDGSQFAVGLRYTF